MADSSKYKGILNSIFGRDKDIEKSSERQQATDNLSNALTPDIIATLPDDVIQTLTKHGYIDTDDTHSENTFDISEFISEVQENHKSLIAEKEDEIQQLKNTLNAIFKQSPKPLKDVLEIPPDVENEEKTLEEEIEEYVNEYLESDTSLTNRILQNYDNTKKEN